MGSGEPALGSNQSTASLLDAWGMASVRLFPFLYNKVIVPALWCLNED